MTSFLIRNIYFSDKIAKPDSVSWWKFKWTGRKRIVLLRGSKSPLYIFSIELPGFSLVSIEQRTFISSTLLTQLTLQCMTELKFCFISVHAITLKIHYTLSHLTSVTIGYVTLSLRRILGQWIELKVNSDYSYKAFKLVIVLLLWLATKFNPSGIKWSAVLKLAVLFSVRAWFKLGFNWWVTNKYSQRGIQLLQLWLSQQLHAWWHATVYFEA